jgi:hypothetical protein
MNGGRSSRSSTANGSGTLGLAHRHAQLFFLQGTVFCAREMKLTKAIDNFFDVIERLEKLPGEITVRQQLDFIRKQAQSTPKT